MKFCEKAGDGRESNWTQTASQKTYCYTTADGTLQDGDEIRVMYTSTGMGSDLGGVWGDYDKRLKGLEISEGTLAPVFSPDRHEYTLILPANKTAVTVTPTAMNKQFQVRTFVGENEYRRSACNRFYEVAI